MNDMRKVIRLARKHGWEIRQGGNNHLQFVSPEGEVVYGDCTPSDHRGVLNTIARLRKAGLPIPHKGPKPKARR